MEDVIINSGEILALKESIVRLEETIKYILSYGSIIVGSMAACIIGLWVAYSKSQSYIRTQDRANLTILTELTYGNKGLSSEITKIHTLTSEEIRPKVEEIRNNVISIINKK